MKVLIFWVKTKDTSVIDEQDLCPTKSEGQETKAKYNGKKFDVKILRKSGKLVEGNFTTWTRDSYQVN